MILLAHLLFGAALGSLIKNPILAVILAFLGHYFLDFFPHIEYSVKNIKEKHWRKAFGDFAKVFTDIGLGIILIFAFSKNQPIIYICAFFAILPDGFSLLSLIFSHKIFDKHDHFHSTKAHFFRNKKISKFWRIYSQIVAVIISIILLKI